MRDRVGQATAESVADAHSQWSSPQVQAGTADLRGVERLDDGVNPLSDPPERMARGPRVAHRAPVGGPIGHSRGELGAALIEAAYVFPVFMVLVLGIMEIGLYMKDDLAVAHSVRAGSRMASASGNDVYADYGVLQSMAREMAALDEASVEAIVVYKATGVGTTPTAGCQVGSIANLCNYYTVADIARPRSQWGCVDSASPDYAWCPNTRDVSRSDLPGPLDGPGTDFVGVWIKYEHGWVTKLFADTSTITDSSVIRLEPRER